MVALVCVYIYIYIYIYIYVCMYVGRTQTSVLRCKACVYVCVFVLVKGLRCHWLSSVSVCVRVCALSNPRGCHEHRYAYWYTYIHNHIHTSNDQSHALSELNALRFVQPYLVKSASQCASMLLPSNGCPKSKHERCIICIYIYIYIFVFLSTRKTTGSCE